MQLLFNPSFFGHLCHCITEKNQYLYFIRKQSLGKSIKLEIEKLCKIVQKLQKSKKKVGFKYATLIQKVLYNIKKAKTFNFLHTGFFFVFAFIKSLQFKQKVAYQKLQFKQKVAFIKSLQFKQKVAYQADFCQRFKFLRPIFLIVFRLILK